MGIRACVHFEWPGVVVIGEVELGLVCVNSGLDYWTTGMEDWAFFYAKILLVKTSHLHCNAGLHIFYGSLLPRLSCTAMTNTIDLITLRTENLMHSLAGRSGDFVMHTYN